VAVAPAVLDLLLPLPDSDCNVIISVDDDWWRSPKPRSTRIQLCTGIVQWLSRWNLVLGLNRLRVSGSWWNLREVTTTFVVRRISSQCYIVVVSIRCNISTTRARVNCSLALSLKAAFPFFGNSIYWAMNRPTCESLYTYTVCFCRFRVELVRYSNPFWTVDLLNCKSSGVAFGFYYYTTQYKPD